MGNGGEVTHSKAFFPMCTKVHAWRASVAACLATMLHTASFPVLLSFLCRQPRELSSFAFLDKRALLEMTMMVDWHG